MTSFIQTKRAKTTNRILSALTAFLFLFSLVIPPSTGYAQTALNLPAVGSMVTPTAAYRPPLVMGMTLHPDNPLKFDFIIDSGDDKLQGEAFQKESQKLINYFLTALTVPEDEMWVNLSPSGWVA